MANITRGLVWELDTEGFLLGSVTRIKKAVLYPNAIGDAVTFSYWGPQSANPTPRATMLQKTVTTSLTTTITSTGNFEAAEAVENDIIEIYDTEDGNNQGHWQIGTVSSADAIIVDVGLGGWGRAGGILTNEATKLYNWKTWAPTTAFKIVSPGTEVVTTEINFDTSRGQRFPNLAINTLSASATVILYIA